MLKIIDLFKLKFYLNYKNKDRFGTTIGGIMSIMIIIAVIFCSIYFSQDFIFQQNPVVSVQEEYDSFQREFLLKPEDNIIAFRIEDYDFNSFDWKGALEIKLYHAIYQNGFEIDNELEIDKCSNVYAGVIDNIDPRVLNSYCIKNLNHTIGGYWDNANLTYLSMKIYMCRNSTNNNNCLSDKQIIESIKGMTLGLYFNDKRVLPNDYKRPFVDSIGYFWDLLDPNCFKSYEVLFDSLILDTDDHPFLGSSHITSDIKRNPIFNKVTTIPFIERQLLEVNFYLTRKSLKYKRTYMKLQNAFANLGGIISLLSLISRIFVRVFGPKLLQIEIVNYIFDFDQIKNSKNKKHSSSLNPGADSILNCNFSKNVKFNLHKMSSLFENYLKENNKEKFKFYSVTEVLKSLICPFKNLKEELKKKETFLTNGYLCIRKQFEIKNFTRKFCEIEFLKKLILNDQQIFTFNYLKTPSIEENYKFTKLDEITQIYYYFLDKNQENLNEKDIILYENIDKKLIEIFNKIN